ncbi:MAG TPA: PQQ-dependent sugar dehydrogenase [Candidatus Limnocylindria bacterium]|nr:PQQ-dependent sugar dehydrogenase [Candidatus Limnocylindria bacterium]
MSPRRILALAIALALLTACASSGQRTPGPTTGGQPGGPATSSPTPGSLPTAGPTAPGDSPAGGTPPGSPGTPATPDAPGSPDTPAASPFDPAAVSLAFEPFASGMGALTYLTHAGDGSGLLYAVEQAGVVRVLERDGSLRSQPLLDLTDRVRAGGEQGLLGLAFHPAYADNGRLFVNYTDHNGDTVVAEFRRSAEAVADPATERIVLRVEQPFRNHNGGMVVFGPDGYLYVSLGDGGGGGDPLEAGQDLGTLLGKILRIDVDGGQPYVVPADNPFVGRQEAQPEIWVWGLRNPWRMSFDRETGALLIADVGQSSWEEVNLQPAGAGGLNFGWNITEGPDCYRADSCDTAGLTAPLAWYASHGGQCAVVGGYAYRGVEFPGLAGAYFFADHCSGLVWAFDMASALASGQAEVFEMGSAGLRPSAFGEDEEGELYLVGHSGEVLRIAARPR